VSAVRVLVVDDQALFREALGTLLGARPEIEVVGEAGDGHQALERAAALAPDVVLMDLHMPVLDGIGATRRLRVEQPGVRVLALTTFDDDEDVFAALRAGALGYLLKDVSSDRLVEAVLAAARGELEEAGVEPEYLELRATTDLSPVERVNGSTLLAVAARVGRARLIDNTILGAQ
jgi:DNA-binding NarL/FixJ family response regulator